MPTNPRHLALLVDWKSAAHDLRPRRPRTRSWVDSPKIAGSILGRLRRALAVLPVGDGTYYADTLLFGGFVAPDGSWTDQKNTVDAAIASISWSGTITERLHLRQLVAVLSLRPGSGTHLRGLFRPDEPVQEAHIRPGEACTCSWRELTEKWLREGFGDRRECPKCAGEARRTPAILSRRQQKLVDTLLVSYAFDTAMHFLLADEEDSEIWICSSDADFAPPLATIAAWGLRCGWLQPRSNTAFGYAEQLTELGVPVFSVAGLLGEEDDNK